VIFLCCVINILWSIVFGVVVFWELLGTMSGYYPCENVKNLLVVLHVFCYRRDSIQCHAVWFSTFFFAIVSFCWGVFVWFSNFDPCVMLLFFLLCFNLPQILFCLYYVCEYFEGAAEVRYEPGLPTSPHLRVSLTTRLLRLKKLNY
jgi:hypothetical protein